MLSSENRLGVPLYRLSNEATKSPSKKKLEGYILPFIVEKQPHASFTDKVYPVRNLAFLQ